LSFAISMPRAASVGSVNVPVGSSKCDF
jgi:hypothetical protein